MYRSLIVDLAVNLQLFQLSFGAKRMCKECAFRLEFLKNTFRRLEGLSAAQKRMVEGLSEGCAAGQNQNYLWPQLPIALLGFDPPIKGQRPLNCR